MSRWELVRVVLAIIWMDIENGRYPVAEVALFIAAIVVVVVLVLL